MALLALAGAAVVAAQQPPADSSQGQVLLTDSLGNLVVLPASSLPQSLLPPARIGLESQVPRPASGAKLHAEVLQRIDAGQTQTLKLFPSAQPKLMSYLAAQDELGNTAVAPGALVHVLPFEPPVQAAKYWLSARGFRYSFDEVLNYTNPDDPTTGPTGIGYATLKFLSKWAVFSDGDSSGWISAQVNTKNGLGTAGQTESAKAILGTLTDPSGTVSHKNGIRVPELAWQQSFRKGEVVLLAGVVSQGNYLDVNTYANSGRGQFINSALINSMVLPLPSFNFGVNLQWQPTESWYGMLGASAGNATAGQQPWTNFSWNDWSVVSEFGYTPSDFLGLGPGVYRIQPFLAQNGGPIQGGVALNLQQQLGPLSPIGWFGRLGIGGSTVSAGASTQVGTGFVMNAPLKNVGLVERLTNDLFGVGFVWSQPSATTQTVYHKNEYVFESFYTLQLSPTTRVQPDIQVIWNPAFNPDPGPATAFAMQWILAW